MGSSIGVILKNYKDISRINEQNLSHDFLSLFSDVNILHNYLEDIGIDDANLRGLIIAGALSEDTLKKIILINECQVSQEYPELPISGLPGKIQDYDCADTDVYEPIICEAATNRGISICFLVKFCNRYNLWKLSTREVYVHYIKPMTSGLRCCFLNLPHIRGSKNVGKAMTFVSHTWESNFGDLVAAVSDGADLNRTVWIDIFSYCQWPSSSDTKRPELEVASIIQQCTSFLLVCSAYKEVLEIKDSDILRRRQKIFPDQLKKKISLFHTWCQYELYVAINTPEVAIVLKSGSHRLSGDVITGKSHHFITDRKLLWMLHFFMDFEQSVHSNFPEKLVNLREVSSLPHGIQGLNVSVRRLLSGSYSSSGYPKVQCAACGDEEAISEVQKDKEKYIHTIAGSGYRHLLAQVMRDEMSLVNCRDSSGMTPLLWSAQGGHVSCIEYLFSQSCDLMVQNDDGIGAVQAAAIGGYDHCVQVLIDIGCDINAKCKNGTNALMAACLGGHLSCVKVLTSHARCDLTTVDAAGKDARSYSEVGAAIVRRDERNYNDKDEDDEDDDDDFSSHTIHQFDACIKVITDAINERRREDRKKLNDLVADYFQQFDY